MVSLRAERERQGLSLDEVAAHARIPIRYLAALERGDEGVLPPGPFQRGYQRQYLEFLGFDPETAVLPPQEPLEDEPEEDPTSETLTITAALEDVPLWRLAFAGFVLTTLVVLALRVIATLLGPTLPPEATAAAVDAAATLSDLGEADAVGGAPEAGEGAGEGQGQGSADAASLPLARLRIRAVEDTRLRTAVDGVESFEGRLPAREFIDLEGSEKIEVWAEDLTNVLIHYNGEHIEPLGAISSSRKLVFVLNDARP